MPFLSLNLLPPSAPFHSGVIGPISPSLSQVIVDELDAFERCEKEGADASAFELDDGTKSEEVMGPLSKSRPESPESKVKETREERGDSASRSISRW